MAGDPVATAASNNPLLSTLVTAVKKAGLVDTLNTSKDITVFAPANSAFAKIPAADLDKTLNDKTALTALLTHHVVKGRLTPSQLAGSHKTLAGDTISIKGTSPNFDVAGAKVLCGNVQTSNATVYILDTVLTPMK
ncbi:fasciclin domain-containing protein [Calidifontibacter terrae]